MYSKWFGWFWKILQPPRLQNMHMHTLYSGVKCNRPTAYTQKHTPTRFWLEEGHSHSDWTEVWQPVRKPKIGFYGIPHQHRGGGNILICFPHLIIEHFNRKKCFGVISDKSEITYYPFNYELNNMTNGHRIITLFEYLHKVFKQIYTKGSPSSSSSTLSSIPNSALLTLPQTSSSALHAHLRAVQSLWSTTTMWYALGFLADTFYQLGIGSWGWGIPCCDWDQVISISLPSIVSCCMGGICGLGM